MPWRGTCTSACARTSAMGSSRTATSTRWTRERASRAPSARRIPWTSRCGRRRRRARTPPGTRPGAAAGHYRRPIAYPDAGSERAQASVGRVREAARRLRPGSSPEDLAPLRDRFFDALAEDFNTPAALAALFDWVREANKRDGVGDAHLREMLGVLGLENLLEAEAAPAADEDTR